MPPDPDRFPFAFAPPADRLLGLAGIHEHSSEVVLGPEGLHVRFGPFRVRTPWDNVRDVCVTGPYRWYRAIGPRMSLSDRGVTFGSSTRAGTCVRFHEPVAALFGRRRIHPGLTVTVEDPEGLRRAIAARIAQT